METYIHRIGRTGRFGRQGLSINFVYDQKSFNTMQTIEKSLNRPIVKVGTEDFDAMEKVRSQCLRGLVDLLPYHEPLLQTLKTALK